MRKYILSSFPFLLFIAFFAHAQNIGIPNPVTITGIQNTPAEKYLNNVRSP